MSYRIVILEESQLVYEIMSELLEKEGFEVELTKSEDKFLETVDSFLTHLVIISTDFFTANIYEFCKNFKSSYSIPVLLTGGAYDPFDEELALSAGADDFIQKPFDGYSLICKVKSLLKIEDSKSLKEFSGEKLPSLTKSLEPLLLTAETTKSTVPSINIHDEKETTLIAEFPSTTENVSIKGFSEFAASSSLDELTPLKVNSSFSKALDDEDFHRLIKEPIKSILNEQVMRKMSVEISLLVREKLVDIINEITPKIVEEIIDEKINATLLSIQTELERELKKSLMEINNLLTNKSFKGLD